MPEAEAVLDASPLILLSRIGHLDLLLALGRPLVVPLPVFEELGEKGSQDLTVRAVGEAPFLQVLPVEPLPDAIVRWDLGKGESSVLAWAREHPGALALLDDLEARRCAESLDIPLLGTAGLVLLAKRRGVVGIVEPLLRELIQAGMYLSERTLGELLLRAGE